tara:strand:+ start:259 stop:372 length:114 start_codon:yes stop_codon:yes gene_type:complete
LIDVALNVFKDYFKIFGSKRNATDEEIKITFRGLSRD